MEKQNLRAKELELARKLAKEYASYYNRRPGVEPPDVPMEVRDELRHAFGHAHEYALEEYKARFACFYGMMKPGQFNAARAIAYAAAMRAPIDAKPLESIDDIPLFSRQALAALDAGHINWPIFEEFRAHYNETIMETER